MLRDTRRPSKPEYGARYPDARPFLATRNPGAGQDFTNLAAAVQLRLRVAFWVANFDSEVPALNRRELGANPRRPTIFRIRGEIYYHPPIRTESLQVGILPGTPIHAALVRLQETLSSERRSWRWKSLTRHHL